METTRSQLPLDKVKDQFIKHAQQKGTPGATAEQLGAEFDALVEEAGGIDRLPHTIAQKSEETVYRNAVKLPETMREESRQKPLAKKKKLSGIYDILDTILEWATGSNLPNSGDLFLLAIPPKDAAEMVYDQTLSAVDKVMSEVKPPRLDAKGNVIPRKLAYPDVVVTAPGLNPDKDNIRMIYDFKFHCEDKNKKRPSEAHMSNSQRKKYQKIARKIKLIYPHGKECKGKV